MFKLHVEFLYPHLTLIDSTPNKDNWEISSKTTFLFIIMLYKAASRSVLYLKLLQCCF